MLGSELTARLPGVGRSLSSVLAEAIAAVRDGFGLAPGNSPYSTASIVRWSEDEIEALVLGDSPAAVRTHKGSVDVLSDERLAGTATAERAAYREHLTGGHGFDAAFAELVAAVQRQERTQFNRDGGFWVAEADPSAAEHALTRTWPAERVTDVALMSDGASAAVTDYGLVDWATLFDEVRAQGAGGWLAGIHGAEAADPDGRRWPRTKRHDDKSVLLLSALER
jgi:hypothetical protein